MQVEQKDLTSEQLIHETLIPRYAGRTVLIITKDTSKIEGGISYVPHPIHLPWS
jgi:hypothetical protein